MPEMSMIEKVYASCYRYVHAFYNSFQTHLRFDMCYADVTTNVLDSVLKKYPLNLQPISIDNI